MMDIGRKRLPHEVPAEVVPNPEDEVFFVTICCLPRGENQLADARVWEVIDATLRVREENGVIRTRLALAMPDHLHGLFAFPGEVPMKKAIADFKKWVAVEAGVKWQRDFFDHRLRTWEDGAAKADYIRMNPVRAGLVDAPEDWRYSVGTSGL